MSAIYMVKIFDEVKDGIFHSTSRQPNENIFTIARMKTFICFI